MKIRVPEPMTRFECNQQGCCCKGWKILFTAADLARIAKQMHEEQVREMTRGMTVTVDEQRRVQRVRLRTVGAEQACQFLAEDGRCSLQVEHGAEVLPHICRAFPGYGVNMGRFVDLCFNVECPEVMNALDESDGLYKLVELDLHPAHHLADRAAHVRNLPPVRLGAQTLSAADLLAVQRVILDELNRRERPALESLAYIFYALARLAKGQPARDFEVRADQSTEPFDAFFESCVSAHQPALLVRVFGTARRFVLDLDLDRGDSAELPSHLSYRPDWRRRVDPDDANLQPLLLRYLAHRVHSPFTSTPSDRALSFAYGTIVHCLATAFRYAAALGSWLSVTDSRRLMKAAIIISEDVYGTFRSAPTSIMPWFEP